VLFRPKLPRLTRVVGAILIQDMLSSDHPVQDLKPGNVPSSASRRMDSLNGSAWRSSFDSANGTAVWGSLAAVEATRGYAEA
jgi:hypothetical protein